MEGNTARLELTWWDELENKDIIVPTTLFLRTDSAKIDITVGNEDTPELECGGYGYIFPVTFTLDRISNRTTPENGDESGNKPETANEVQPKWSKLTLLLKRRRMSQKKTTRNLSAHLELDR